MTKVFLHIGTRKSGTSYLQKALRDSVPALAEQGVELTFKTRKGHVERQLAPLKHMLATGDAGPAQASMRRMVARIKAKPDMRHLITLEDLAELPQSVADLYLEALREFDTELVVTVRNWGSTIPSEWQQCVKERFTGTYRDFVAAIADRTPEADQFLMRQDLPTLIQRWSGTLDPGKVHVIAVPPTSRTEGTLVELFCGLVGIDPASLRMPKGRINASISLDQAELLRRVNIALGDRLPFENGYQTGIREWLTRGTLMKRAESSIRIPEEFGDWCVRAAREQYDGIVALGVDLVGDPEDLVPGKVATGPAEVSDPEVLATAVVALADLGELQWKEQQELRRAQEGREAARKEVVRLRGELAELRKTAPASGGRADLRARLRSLRAR